jgi:hypothetical protein
MDLSHWLWLATAVYALHALEEFMLDWRDWARAVIGLPVEWSHFYVVNFLVVVLGVVAANLAPAAPAVALGFAAVMVINALLFHVAPVIRSGGRFSPGLFSAVVLMLPVAVACYLAAARADLLTTGGLILSVVIGAGQMATPIVHQKIKDRPYFRPDPHRRSASG